MKKHLLLFAMILLPLVASADPVEINGIYYNLITKIKKAEVTSNPNKYTGSVVIPETVSYQDVTYSVTSIERGAFSYCSGLTSVTIPNSVTSIGADAFHRCSGLTSITIPNSVTTMGNGAFQACYGLTSVTIGNSVTSIGNDAFRLCTALTSVTIPNSVTIIDDGAFEWCSKLTSVTIGNGLTSIGFYAFKDCSALKKVIVHDIAAWCGIKFGGQYSNPYSNPLFYARHLYSDENTEIKDLIIPNSVTSIGERAFDYCSGLTSVTIPNSVTSIGENAFYDCYGLKKVIVHDIAAWCGINFGFNPLSYAHHLYSDDNTEITNLVIPNSVTSIEKSAFSGCSGLTSVTIPSSVTSIGEYAFSDCSALKKVIVHDIAAWCGINFGSNPLSYAHHLYSDDNTEITNLVIPNSVTSIGSSTFWFCSGLTSVTIPNSVTSIGGAAFYNCSGLTSVAIPNSVTSIGGAAFYNCSGLTSITIGSGIKTIYSSAFASCPELTDVTCYAENVPSTATDAFKDSYIEYATLHVPASAVNAYKAADPWKNFKSIIEANPTGIKTIENTQIKNNTFYDLNGVRLSEPKKGINIINGKKVVIK